MTKQAALEAIKHFSEIFPKDALMEIQANKADFIPELLDALDYAYKNAKELSDESSDYFLHMYAMHLLAEFREKRAFPLLAALLRLPENEISFVLGDCITEGFSQILFSTYDNENMQMLFDIIENTALYEWARLAALKTYELLINAGVVAEEEGISYLRTLIYEKLPSDDTDVVFTGIVSCAIDAHLVEMIPDVRFLYENNCVEKFALGDYDDFIDWIFYEKRPEKAYIDDAISEMRGWACFKKDERNTAKPIKINARDIHQEKKHEIVPKKHETFQEKTAANKPKKIGRNDPCPCGSSKKYKKCCINKPQNIMSKDNTSQNNASVMRLEERYDLLKMYPKDSAQFQQLYEKEAVDIDILVYKALHHRAIPLWVERDREGERIGKIHYLDEALTLFENKAQQEQITSFAAYDRQYMVHYRSNEWVLALAELIVDDDSVEFMAIRQRAQDTLRRFSNDATV